MAKRHHLFLAKTIHNKLVWFKYRDYLDKEELFEEYYREFGHKTAKSTLRAYFLKSLNILKKKGLIEKGGVLTYPRTTLTKMNPIEFYKQLKMEHQSTMLFRPKLPKLQVMQLNLISKKNFQSLLEALISNNSMYFNPQVDAYMLRK